MFAHMRRSLWFVLMGVMAMHCSGGDDSESSSGVGTTGTTGDTTGVVTGTADATTGGTMDATTGTTVTTQGSTTGPPPTSDVSAAEGMTNGGPAPEFDCSALPPGVVGVEYSASFEATGGMGGSYSWEIGFGDKLPPGLALIPQQEGNSVDISGTPTEAGDFTFQVILTSNGTETPGQEQCEIVIAAAGTPGDRR